jgi:hypothetical protein
MNTNPKLPHLTKSKYVAGLQCRRKLWLDCHEPMEFVDADPGSIMDIGNKIGVHAHALFPGGVLVREEAYEHSEAVARTLDLMADQNVPAIFEAAFEYDDVRIRVDILERTSDTTWGIREVKSGNSSKPHYIDDISIQYYVLTGSGLNVDSAELAHVNKEYEMISAQIKWDEFFARVEVLSEVQAKQIEVKTELAEQQKVVGLSDAPEIFPYKNRCSIPYHCDYWLECTYDKPKEWIQRLHGFRFKTLLELKEREIHLISDLPEDVSLSDVQRAEAQVIKSNKPLVGPNLQEALQEFGPPAYYLDFEYLGPTIPIFEGMKPGQRLPFQWSVHYVENREELDQLDGAKDSVFHKAYLADGNGDFRKECAEKLIEALGEFDAPIIVYYESAEIGAIKSLAECFPDLSEHLLALLPRVKDILPVVRSNTCLPGYFANKISLSTTTYSIKNTVTPLAPSFRYEDLDGISVGTAAAESFYRIMTGELKKDESAGELRKELLEYCRYDTLAMINVHRALIQMVEGTNSAG